MNCFFKILKTPVFWCRDQENKTMSLPLSAQAELKSIACSALHCVEHDVTLAHLSTLTSKATSLGASSPSAAVVKKALERKGGVKSVCIPDELAMQAAIRFAGQYHPLSHS